MTECSMKKWALIILTYFQFPMIFSIISTTTKNRIVTEKCMLRILEHTLYWIELEISSFMWFNNTLVISDIWITYFLAIWCYRFHISFVFGISLKWIMYDLLKNTYFLILVGLALFGCFLWSNSSILERNFIN